MMRTLVVSLFLIVTGLSSRAATTVTPNPLLLTGNTGGAVEGDLLLSTDSATSIALTFARHDLVDAKSGAVINARQINAPAVSAIDGPAQRVTIAIANATRPGTFTGTLELWADKKLLLTLPVTAKVGELPKLTLPQTTAIKAVDIETWPGEWLANVLLSSSERELSEVVEVPNSGGLTTATAQPELVLVGTASGQRLKPDAYTLSIETPQSKNARGQILSLPITLIRDKVPPDQYSGSLFFTVNGIDAPQSVPVTLSVRTEPFLPLLIILAGILLGRLIRFAEGDGARQSGLLGRLDRVERTVDPNDLIYILDALRAARSDVYDMQFTIAEPKVSALEERAGVLLDLDFLDNNLAPNDPILAEVGKARRAVQLGDNAAAKVLVDQIRTAILAAPQTEAATTKAATSVPTRMDEMIRHTDGRIQTSERIRNVFSGLFGLALEARAESYRWLLRPLFFLLLIALLVYAGMEALYVSNLSFGAGRLRDYVGLLMWGTSADIASKTLSSVRLR